MNRARLLFVLIGGFLLAGQSWAAVVHVTPEMPFWIPTDTLFDPVFLDLDGDGAEDIAFGRGGIETRSGAVNGSRLVADAEVPSGNANMESGDFIGLELDEAFLWDPAGLVINGCASGGGGVGCFGNFRGGRDYLGIEFNILGGTHYGWLQVESSPFTTGAGIIDWAYESEPGVGIFAGQIPEPSAAVLALIGLCLVCVRRR